MSAGQFDDAVDDCTEYIFPTTKAKVIPFHLFIILILILSVGLSAAQQFR